MDRLFTYGVLVYYQYLAGCSGSGNGEGRPSMESNRHPTCNVRYVQQLSEPGSSRQKETRTSITYAHAGLAS